MVSRPYGTNAFEFVVVSALRAAQLMKGCTPRVPAGYKHIVTAQLEVAAGKVAKIIDRAQARRRLGRPPPLNRGARRSAGRY